MLDILNSIFQTIIHTLSNLIHLIVSIPTYIGWAFQWVNLLPPFILIPLSVALFGVIIICIKRLVF